MTDPKQAIVKRPETAPVRVDQKLSVWEGSSAVVDQGRHWSSALIWIACLLFGSSLIWAFTAKLDQTISVRGRLVPAGRVREVESPTAGVISEVYVDEGQEVKQGQALFSVEAKGLSSRRQALLNTLSLFDLQAEGLDAILRSDGDPDRLPPPPPVPPVSDPELAAKLVTVQQESQQLRSQITQIANKLDSKLLTLELQEKIAADYKPLFEVGAMARNPYLQQVNRVQEMRAEVANLEAERSRLMGQVASQLNQLNRQRITLKAELEGLKAAISYRMVKAPIDGKVFDSGAIKRYDLVNTTEVVLKLVPANRLEASVNIRDGDIGFVEVGMPASVSVDSFPSGEFGYITGEVTSLALDALPPSQETQTQAYSFPATIKLKEQAVLSGDKELNLQSGMAVTANIKLRSRPVISIVSDMFTRQLDGVKRFR